MPDSLWFPIAGLSAGALTYTGILSPLKTITYLSELYADYLKAKAPTDPSSQLYPHIRGGPGWLQG